MTIVDPGAFTKPWTATATMDLRVDTEMLETVCEGSSERWLGSLADVRATTRHVDTDVLARYVGEYSGMWGTVRRTVRVRLEGGVLRVNGTLGETVELIAQSDRVFANSDGVRERVRTPPFAIGLGRHLHQPRTFLPIDQRGSRSSCAPSPLIQ